MDEARYIQVFEKPEFVKDKVTGALLNTDSSALALYKQQKHEKARLEARMSLLEKDVSEIKNLLTGLKEMLGNR